MSEKLVMALVGFGNSANRYHLPYLLENENVQIKTIYTPSLNKRPEDQAALEARGIVFTDDLDQVVNDSEIQFVSVITPAPSHFELAKRLLEAGKNVMVEKPFVTSVAEGKELIALANEKGLLITHSKTAVSMVSSWSCNTSWTTVSLVSQSSSSHTSTTSVQGLLQTQVRKLMVPSTVTVSTHWTKSSSCGVSQKRLRTTLSQ